MIRLFTCAVGLSIAFACMPVLSEGDVFVCMESTQEKCDSENQNLRLFMQGREALEQGRQSGDLRQAHELALQLLGRDEKHGRVLMKFVYLQVGQGVHKDLVEAYRWIQNDLQAGRTYKRLNLERVLDLLKARMTPEQLAALG